MIWCFVIASNKNSQIRCFLNSRIIFMECSNRHIFLRTFHRKHIRFISNGLKITTTNKRINLDTLLFFYFLHCTIDFFKTAMETALKCYLGSFIFNIILRKVYFSIIIIKISYIHEIINVFEDTFDKSREILKEWYY